MRRGKIMICLFTAVLLAVAAFFWSREPEREVEIPISVLVSAEDGEEEIRCWKNSAGEYYVFLPGYAQLSQVRLHTWADGEIRMNGAAVTDGMDCGSLPLNTACTLDYTFQGETYAFSLTFTRSANVPALYLNVKSGSMDYIHREKGNSESGTLRLYTADGTLDHAGDFSSLDGRGSSTWNLAKKPYNLKLTKEGNLLGMGAAQKWVLLANAFDPSQLRNKLVYDSAAELGLAYSPECRWVDLYLNGEYAGLYLLCERNEVHPERVNLGETGSFLVSKEWEWRMSAQNQPYIMLDSHAALRLHDTSMDTEEVRRIWQSAENAILAEDGIDPDTGKHWRELIDVDSWAMKYLVEEVFGNVDGGTLSQFFYYDSSVSGRIYAGPVWDYDLTMGNTVAWPYPSANMFYVNRPDVYASVWFSTLYDDPEFYARITTLYETAFRPLLTELLENGIDEYAAQIAQAAQMNDIRWSSGDAVEETTAIRAYLEERMEFLDSIWCRGEEYVTVLVSAPDSVKLRYALRPGESLPRLPDYESTDTTLYEGWYNVDTSEVFDVTQPIYRDVSIALKATSLPGEEAEEEVSPLRFAPLAVFAGLLVTVCLWDKKRCGIDCT